MFAVKDKILIHVQNISITQVSKIHKKVFITFQVLEIWEIKILKKN